MTLATVTETTRPRRMRLRLSGRLTFSLDALLMTASLAICALLFTSGGLEAFIGAAVSASTAARRATPGARWRAAF